MPKLKSVCEISPGDIVTVTRERSKHCGEQCSVVLLDDDKRKWKVRFDDGHRSFYRSYMTPHYKRLHYTVISVMS